MNKLEQVIASLSRKKVSPVISAILCLAMVFGLSASALSLSYSVSAAKTEALIEQTGGSEVQDYIPISTLVKLSYEEPDIPLILDASPSTAEITISLKDVEGVVLAGIPYTVTVEYTGEQEEGAEPVETKTLTDEDCDGVIRYEKPVPGTYVITLEKIEGFVSPEPVTVTVEKPVEHKAVKVEVKKASAAEMKQEDANYGQSGKGGGVTITDTVEYVESTQTVIPGSGEEREVKDENGNTLYLSVPETTDFEGATYLLNPDGSRSGIKVTLNGDGTIATAMSYEVLNAGGDEEGGGETGGEDPPAPVDPDPVNPDPVDPDPVNPDPVNPDPVNPDPVDPNTGNENPGGGDGGDPNPPTGDEPTPPVTEEPQMGWVDVKSRVLDPYGAPKKDDAGNYLYRFASVEAKKEVVGEKIKYTGWQTLDGRKYFFDKDGNKDTGTQIIQGSQYIFDSDGALVNSTTKGIDVSQWNCYSTIDWNAVRNSGVSFVIVRCGIRGSTLGGIYEDDMFISNIRGAKAAGLKVGVYFFTLAATEQQAVEEASACVQMCARAGVGLDYPIFMDLEDPVSSGAQTSAFKSLSVAQRTQVVNAFLETVRNSGYRAGLYANKYWLSAKVSTGALGSGTVIWLAHYTSQTDYTGRYEMWQYSGSGSVPGIRGAVDMNISYLGY